MHKSDRLFQLTNILRLRQPVTAQALADELNVSIRTVYRYIDDLSANGIPVYGEPGLGYRLDDSFQLPPLNLTVDELDALIIGMKMVSGWTGSELPEAAQSLLHKIEAVMPDFRKELNPDLFHVPHIHFPDCRPNTWDPLRHAIRQHRVTTLRYRDEKENESERTVYPLGLFYWGGKWTLGAWCTLREDFRSFRSDRIQELTVSSDPFDVTDRINLDAYLRQQMTPGA